MSSRKTRQGYNKEIILERQLDFGDVLVKRMREELSEIYEGLPLYGSWGMFSVRENI